MENKKVVRIILSLIIIFTVITYTSWAEESLWKLTADKIIFNWETQDFTAEGNVNFSGEDIAVIADLLEGNLKEGMFKAEGNVTFKDKNGESSAEYLVYQYKGKKAIIKNVKLKYPVPESSEKIYISGDEVTWKSGDMQLEKGTFSTCEYEKPHYFLSTSQLEYSPNDKIIFINVIFYLKVPYTTFYIPVFYVPYYALPLTKEPSPFPQIGYDSSLGIYLTYPFSYSLFGMPGLFTFLVSQYQGAKFSLTQKYALPNISGNISSSYLYNYILNTDELRFSINGIYKILPNLSLSFNSQYAAQPYLSTYLLQNSGILTYTSEVLNVSLQGNQNKTKTQDTIIGNLNSSIKLGGNTYLRTNLRYNKVDTEIQDREDLTGYVNLGASDNVQNFYIYANERWTNMADFSLKKLPEIYYSRNFSLFNIPIKADLTLGNYIEPTPPFETKTWKLSASISGSPKINLPIGSITSNLGFRQDLYGTQDARYAIFGNIGYSLRIANLLSGSISYNFNWLGTDIITGDEGNSPFYFDYSTNLSNLSLQTTIGTPNINISLQESYNGIYQTLTPLSISGIIKSGKELTISARTLYYWTNNSFSSLFVQGTLHYPSWFSLTFGTLYDINTNTFQRLDFRAAINITGDWHVKGNLALTGYYLPSTGFILYNLNLEKDLHCFNARISYNFYDQSIQFNVYLKAFPKEGIEFIGGPSGFTLLPSF
ncbi:MAG: LPS-assembly protein LptD [Dictyoglomaceae bacterium]